MGYCFVYTLTADNFSPDLEDVICKEIDNLDIFEEGDCKYGWGGYGSWSFCDEDLIAISEKFPNVLFTLTGHGDNADDIWRTCYKGGMLQTDCADVVYKVFDETKLHPLEDMKGG